MQHARRIAVVGAGPSALFLVAALLDKGTEPLHVDVIDRLPAPYGLVRYGVAPDHANIKAVIGTLQKVFERDHVRFLGNVEFGKDLTLSDLQNHYDAVCFAVGASRDRQLNVPGEDLTGSICATDFVMWYSGHPDAAFGSEIHQTMASVIPRTEAVAVIGAGNVAIDVTRILAKSVDELRTTDIPDYVLEVLAESNVSDIHVVARRGPAQAKFTTAELRELGEIPGVNVRLDARVLELDEASAAAAAASAIVKRNMDVFRDFAGRSPSGAPRRIHLRFLTSPVEIRGDGRAAAIVLQRNRLDEKQEAVPLDETEVLDVDMVLRSVGYRGVPLVGVPFDERRHVIPNDRGRVRDVSGATIPGLYTAGWIKRGPSGVIGTNKADALETAKAMLADLPSLPRCEEPDPRALDALLVQRGLRVVDWHGWLELDRREIEAGRASGRERVKLTDFSAAV
jgi:ferredoxin--NADP+ reductase